jgi:hypothetical protein
MVGTVRKTFKKTAYSVVVAVLAFAIYGVSIPRHVAALPLPNRSLRLGSVEPGAITTNTFSFSYSSPDDIGSIMFEYCTSPLTEITCDTPTGLDATNATLTDQQGETGFTVLTAQTNKIILTRTPAVSPVTNSSTYVFDGVQNPTGAPGTFFVRISTHQSTDASDGNIDFGAVANSTTQAVTVSSEVPPILKFCVGLTIASDCTTADGNLIDLGDLSTAKASAGSSQMLAATNAEFGLAIAMYGTTMTSGNNIIPALAAPTPNAPGNAQFGVNLRKNTDPAVGQDPSGGGIANPASLYNTPNKFVFHTGDVVATSPAATDTRKFTASYLVNVTPSQPPGVYTATLTYICTASF